MAATATINAKVEPAEKAAFTQTAEALGLSPSSAIKVFARAFIEWGGFPFDVRQPRFNAETEAAFQEAQDIIDGKVAAKSYTSFDAFLADLSDDRDTDD
ncbi:MAG: type II toxin-antitoxin system RelB/DinJ family antitoxin [Propionibacteriaceae bacterium]|nr:type II toxin-antitoxin system RelB/DinJ family antitoxin [Propionibacteriaceae bacterium]